MRRYAKVFCAVFTLLFVVTLANGDEDFFIDHNNRDKRTLDLVLRGFADIFGYDIQKRPTVIPPPPPKTLKHKPLPPPPPPKPTKATPKKVTTPNLLKEIVRKSFDINFNWKHNHKQPIIPVGPRKPVMPPPPPPKMPLPPTPKTTKMPNPPPKHPMHPAPPKSTMMPQNPVHKTMKPMLPVPPPKPTAVLPKPIPTKEEMQPKETPQKIEHQNEEQYIYYQPEEDPANHGNYETRYIQDYEQPVYYSKYAETPLETPPKQYEDVEKLKYDFDKNFENIAHQSNKNNVPQAPIPQQYHEYEDFAGFNEKQAPPQAQAPEHNFDKHYEDFIHYNDENAAPQIAIPENHPQKQAVSKEEPMTSLHEFWQKSPLKNDHGYKFLVEEGSKENLRAVTTEKPLEDGLYYKTYYYYPQEEEGPGDKASGGQEDTFGLRITTTPNPHRDEVELVPHLRPMKLRKEHNKMRNDNNHGTFIPTKLEGDETFIPTRLQRLQNEDTKVFHVGPSPFDHEYDSSEVKATNVNQKGAVKNEAQPRGTVKEDPQQRYVYFYQPDSYDNDYTFTNPPQRNVEATGVPKIDAEDDGDLSRNAKVVTKEYSKRIVTLHKNADTRMNA